MSSSQLTFTCSKSLIETLEKGVKYVQSSQQKQQNDINAPPPFCEAKHFFFYAKSENTKFLLVNNML